MVRAKSAVRSALAIVLTANLVVPAGAFAEEGQPSRLIAPSMTGDSGILRVVSARVGNPGYWDIGGHGLYFQQKPFISETSDGGSGDYNEFTGGVGSISWAAMKYLEFYASSQVRENFNSSKDDVPIAEDIFDGNPDGNDTNIPNLDHANGSVIAGFKLSLPLGEKGPLWLGLKAGTRSPPNVDEIQFRPDTFGGEVIGIATLDMTERAIPFRLHLNGGYIVDRSGVLRVPGENPARTFALGLSDYNYYAMGAGIEVPTKYVTPFVEFSANKVADPEIGFDASPSFVTPGLRITPVDGLAMDIAMDFGLATVKVAGVPATPDRQVIFGASYAFASRKQHREFLRESGEISEAARLQIDQSNAEVARLKEELEAERLRADTAEEGAKDTTAEMAARMQTLEGKLRALSGFRGLVLDADTFAPLGDSVVSFPDTNLSRILADATSGFFRSYTLPPGTVSVSVSKQGYETLLQSVSITGENKDDVVRFLLKKEGGGAANNAPGVFKGRILDENGKPVAATLSFPDAPFKTKQIAINNGAFSIRMPPGLYQVDVKADKYLLQGRRISVGPNETVVYDFNMRKRPIDPRVVRAGDKLTLKDVINFGFNSDVIDRGSYAILDEVADIILSNPEFSLIRIEGHTDDVGSAAYNLSLSDRRAKSVVNYLLNKGIPPEKMQAVGWGKAKPVAGGSDDSARAINRRVEFNIIESG